MTQSNPFLSVEQYMDVLAGSDVGYEYWDGETVARAGASLRHNLITMNIGGQLWQQLRGKDCTVAHSDQLVKEESSQRYLFPDVVIHCKQGRLERSPVDTVLDPIVVFEVSHPVPRRSTGPRSLRAIAGLSL